MATAKRDLKGGEMLDGEGGYRTSLDVNRVLWRDKLAVRFSQVLQNTEYNLQPSGVKQAVLMALGGLALFGLGQVAPPSFMSHFSERIADGSLSAEVGGSGGAGLPSEVAGGGVGVFGLGEVDVGIAKLERAERIIQQHRIEKLPVVDKAGRLRGLFTFKDIQKRKKFPNACKDDLGRLRVAAAVGIAANTLLVFSSGRQVGLPGEQPVGDSAHFAGRDGAFPRQSPVQAAQPECRGLQEPFA